MQTMEYLINLNIDRNKEKDIDKEWINNLKKDLILKTVRIDNEIKNTKDYVCKKRLTTVISNLFVVIKNIQELERYLED
ncbi:MAG: hypothetical protein KHZ90_08435 [Veillonella parvula]|uniref:Uncharacterized protein n=1 Tax=Veillonella parvula TaxID=29466 RepID=A0A942WQW6_VEIPA|nr:hypothetical protein [Veillonella parvula]EGT3606770.1 hypothetical protein [Clostridium perfringens]MBS4893788.1 hypothetical protein [Veillonella parvula]